MILSFADQGTEDIYNGICSPKALKTCPKNLHNVARRKLDQLNSVTNLRELTIPPSNNLHPLERERIGQHAIRINDKYRVCFAWISGQGPAHVEITDYH